MTDYHKKPRRPSQSKVTEIMVRLYCEKRWSIKEISKATSIPIKFVIKILKSGGVSVTHRSRKIAAGGIVHRG